MKNKSYKIRKLEAGRFSIMTDNLDYCFVCGRPYPSLHEVFFGPNRQHSMEYGCVLPLCISCHERIHNDRAMDLHYKVLMQDAFELAYPDDDFLRIFHKNYKN